MPAGRSPEQTYGSTVSNQAPVTGSVGSSAVVTRFAAPSTSGRTAVVTTTTSWESATTTPYRRYR